MAHAQGLGLGEKLLTEDTKKWKFAFYPWHKISSPMLTPEVKWHIGI